MWKCKVSPLSLLSNESQIWILTDYIWLSFKDCSYPRVTLPVLLLLGHCLVGGWCANLRLVDELTMEEYFIKAQVNTLAADDLATFRCQGATKSCQGISNRGVDFVMCLWDGRSLATMYGAEWFSFATLVAVLCIHFVLLGCISVDRHDCRQPRHNL